MKLSLVEVVQNILSRLDSDEVNSINDNTESRQVAEIVRSKYYDILSRANLPEHNQLFQLTASGDADSPVLMSKPSDVVRIDWIKYDKRETEDEDSYQYVIPLSRTQYMDHIHSFDVTETNTDYLTLNSIRYYYKDDAHPSYYHVVDDQYVIFDSFDSDLENTLQTSKSLAFGLVLPTFLLEDDYIPELDDQQFSLLMNEATSVAFVELKQITNEKAEQEARRQWTTLQKNKDLHKLPALDSLPNFGR